MTTNNATNNVIYTGNATLLDSQSASNEATLDFIDGFSSEFTSYVFEIEGINVVSPQTEALFYRISTDGGASWEIGVDYVNVLLGYNNSGTTSNIGVTAPAGFLTSTQVSYLRDGVYGTVKFYGLSQSSAPKRGFVQTTWGDTAGLNNFCTGSSWYSTAGGFEVNGIQFFFNTGNILSGTIRMFGVS